MVYDFHVLKVFLRNLRKDDFFLLISEERKGTEISVKCVGRVVLQEEVNSQPITLREFAERVNEL